MRKKALVAAMSAGIAVSSLGVQQAQAEESLLFPFFLNADGFFSLLTLRTDVGDALGSPSIWYYWYYDDLTTAPQECSHEDGPGNLTPFDMSQQSVVAPGLPGGLDLPAAFGDASVVNYSLVSPTLGFMIVESFNDPEGAFSGQMMIIDAVDGFIWAYKGINNPVGAFPWEWTGPFTSHFSYDMIWYPEDLVDTLWYVLVTGNMFDSITTGSPWGGSVTMVNGFGAAWDRDENPRSGQQPHRITCFDIVDRSNFLTTAQVNHTVNGGWSWEFFVPTNDFFNPANPVNASGALVDKLEFVPSLGPSFVGISKESAFPNFPY